VNIKKFFAKLVFGELNVSQASTGLAVENRMVKALQATPNETFDELLQLNNLQNENTGYVHVYAADKIDRATSLSIDILPGMRYFNIHIIPDHHYDIPRFNFEGMVTTKGSQLSMDLYPDQDIVMNFDVINQHYKQIERTYLKAKQHREIKIEPSRLPHMRALCSPFFLLANKIPESSLSDMETFALQYFEEWLKIYKTAELLTDDEAEFRLQRRKIIAKTIVDNDPDRDKVVDVFGEKTTILIEKASLL
jgi:hypothetical protein